MKYVLDTNVYLGAARSEANRSVFQAAFYPLLPATWLSAVVAYELEVNARNRRTQELISGLVRLVERTGRIVTPAFVDWREAAAILSLIHEREPGWRSKLPALLNDVLIALGARRIGATLITFNAKDFELIRRYTDFRLRVLVAGS